MGHSHELEQFDSFNIINN